MVRPWPIGIHDDFLVDALLADWIALQFCHGSAWAGSADLESRRGHRGRREPIWRSLPLAKNLPGFLMPDPCFTGISRSSPRMAADYPFRPCGIHHNSMRDREDGRSVPESRR